jgi:Lamin Tail Domain
VGIRIVTIQYDRIGADVFSEWVLLENVSGPTVVMAGWTLTDRASDVFMFPAFSLAAGAQARIWTKAGADTLTDLFWSSARPVWNNDPGDLATLWDEHGVEVARYSYRNFVADSAAVGLGGGGAMYGPVISPSAPKTMFVSCDMTGLYRTTDAGLNWHMLDTRVLQGTTRFTVAYDPTRAGHLVAFHPVQGLQESFDDGVGFGRLQPALPLTGGFPPSVTAVGFPQIAPDRLLVGTRQGLYQLDPTLGAWANVASVPADVVGFAFPAAGAPWFVATIDDIYSSVDLGQNWASIGATLPARPLGQPFDPPLAPDDPLYVASRIRGFAGAASAGGYVLYASVATVQGDVQTQPGGTRVLTAGGVYRYDSGVGSWARATPNINVTNGDQGGGTPIPRFERLAVADAAPDSVYVSVINTTYDPLVYKGQLAGGAWTWSGIYRWTTAPVNVEFGWFEAAGNPAPRYGFGLGGPPRGLAVAPADPDLAVMVNTAAAYATADGGAGAPAGQPDWYQRFTTPAGSGWRTSGLDVTSVWNYEIHPAKPQLHFACCTDIGLARSQDGGTSWDSIVWAADIGGAQERWANFYELAFEPAPGGRIWAAVADQHDIPHESQVRAASVGAGAVLASDTDGASWFKVNTTSLPGPVVSVINNEAADPAELYASVWGTGVYRSADRGQTWTPHGAFPLGASTRCGRLEMRGGTLYCVVAADASGTVFRPGDLYALAGGSGTWVPVAAGGATLAQAVAPGLAVPVDFGFGRWMSSGDIYLCTQSIQGSSGGGGIYQFDNQHGWQRIPVPFPAEYGDTVQAFAPYCVWADGFDLRLYVTSSHGLWCTQDAMEQPAQQQWTEITPIPFLYTQRIEFGPAGQLSHLSTFGGGVWPVNRTQLPFSGG